MRGARPVLFAPKLALERLVERMEVPRLDLVDFDTQTTASAWRDGTAVGWTKKLPPLGEYTRVVSDNLVEILECREDAILSGSFLWHQLDGMIDKRIVVRDAALLAAIRPTLIASELFALDGLEDLTKARFVGLCRTRPMSKRAKTSVLIACGRGGDLEEETRRFVEDLCRHGKIPFETVWVEPSCLPKVVPPVFKPATFTPEMYDGLIAAVIRPGLGTVTDAILSGARIFAYVEDGNNEMVSNAHRLEASGLGRWTSDPYEAWKLACMFASDREARKEFDAIAASIDDRGAEAAADIILEGVN